MIRDRRQLRWRFTPTQPSMVEAPGPRASERTPLPDRRADNQWEPRCVAEAGAGQVRLEPAGGIPRTRWRAAVLSAPAGARGYGIPRKPPQQLLSRHRVPAFGRTSRGAVALAGPLNQGRLLQLGQPIIDPGLLAAGGHHQLGDRQAGRAGGGEHGQQPTDFWVCAARLGRCPAARASLGRVGGAADDYRIGVAAQVAEAVLRQIDQLWGTEAMAATHVPSRASDVRFRRWFAKSFLACGRHGGGMPASFREWRGSAVCPGLRAGGMSPGVPPLR
jgi:hypothetical protein